MDCRSSGTLGIHKESRDGWRKKPQGRYYNVPRVVEGYRIDSHPRSRPCCTRRCLMLGWIRLLFRVYHVLEDFLGNVRVHREELKVGVHP
ncbi:unnamed protein product, partial [Ilex paraguariensis]